ncbi:MAG: CBS domain-containing protein [Acidobacteriota bacterium]
MKVREIMTEDVKTCAPDNSLSEAAAVMWDVDCGVVPVVGDDGKLVGMITDRDIAIALGTRNRLASDIRVSEAMSKQVYSCAADDDIHAALKTMRKDRVRRLPVVNQEGLLEGIVSINDIALHAERFDGHRTKDLTYDDFVNTFKTICEHRHTAQQKMAAH